VQSLRDHEADHRVAEELEALVVTERLVGVLVEPRAVDERAREKRGVAEREAQALGELSCRARRARRVSRP
jgi:predicted TIM-barrel fold metal-dependent hydrolase